jgi:hypothetical protein
MLFECDGVPEKIEIGNGQKEGEYSLTFNVQSDLPQTHFGLQGWRFGSGCGAGAAAQVDQLGCAVAADFDRSIALAGPCISGRRGSRQRQTQVQREGASKSPGSHPKLRPQTSDRRPDQSAPYPMRRHGLTRAIVSSS